MEIENIFTISEQPLVTFGIAAAAALLVGYLVQALGRRLLLRITKRLIVVDALVRRTVRPMQLVMPLLFLQFVLFAAPGEWKLIPYARHGVGLIFIFALTWLVVSAISGVAATIAALKPVSASNNLEARRIHTQTRIVARTLMGVVWIIGFGIMLTTFPGIRAIGASLLASAGLAGIVAGLAARPVLGNLIAGLQIALSQPIRIDDVVVIEGEWGRIEEITSTYIVIAVWDERRLVVPLQWLIEHPFQNWTRNTSQIIGTVYLWLDYGAPMAALRAELDRICKAASEWDGRLSLLQVTDASASSIQVRALVTSIDSSRNWDLRCKVREGLIGFMQENYPQQLPRQRNELSGLLNEENSESQLAGMPPQAAHAADSGQRRRPGPGESSEEGKTQRRPLVTPAPQREPAAASEPVMAQRRPAPKE